MGRLAAEVNETIQAITKRVVRPSGLLNAGGCLHRNILYWIDGDTY